jgi:hypothetical protein
MVEFSPFTWLPLVPVMAFMQQIKLLHEASLGDDLAAVTAGFYVSTPLFFVLIVVIELFGIAWSLYNWCHLYAIKTMLRPHAALSERGTVTVNMPKVYERDALEEYNARWCWLLSVTHVLALATGMHAPAEHAHHSLFGRAGRRGPELLLLSIKLNTWFLAMGATFTFTSLVNIDIISLTKHGYSASVVAELTLYGINGLSFVMLLFVMMTASFQMYNVLTSIEGTVRNELLERAAKA